MSKQLSWSSTRDVVLTSVYGCALKLLHKLKLRLWKFLMSTDLRVYGIATYTQNVPPKPKPLNESHERVGKYDGVEGHLQSLENTMNDYEAYSVSYSSRAKRLGEGTKKPVSNLACLLTVGRSDEQVA